MKTSTELVHLSELPELLRLTRWLVAKAGGGLSRQEQLEDLLTERLGTSGMTSVRFFREHDLPHAHWYGSTAAELHFEDNDGIPVTAALMLDQEGRLFELDIFKANFLPVQRIPVEASGVR